jgi:hypothetical protein
MTKRQLIAFANPCRTAPQCAHPLYLHYRRPWSLILTLNALQGEAHFFGGQPMWQASAAYHDDHGPIPVEKWNSDVRRQADRLIEDSLDDVGDPRRTLVEIGSYALHVRRCCTADEVRRLESAWHADEN